MSASTFKNKVSITHIGTATAILDIDGIIFLTDPFFSPAGTEWNDVAALKVHDDPALKLEELPYIDAVLLSHENHPDNLDEFGRRLLDGRHVVTTNDGAKNLAPRAQCSWFQRLARERSDGRPNAIYFSGDTVYIEELSKIADKYHITVALMNCGKATFYEFTDEGKPGQPGDSLQITMDGRQAARLLKDLKADVLVPMHYESWDHFKQGGNELAQEFKEEGVLEKVRWLNSGKAVEIN
ncbi:unnamed protein product [Alternaria alternata]